MTKLDLKWRKTNNAWQLCYILLLASPAQKRKNVIIARICDGRSKGMFIY